MSKNLKMFNSKKEVIEALFAGKKLIIQGVQGYYFWSLESIGYCVSEGGGALHTTFEDLFKDVKISDFSIYTEPKTPQKIKLFRYTYWYAEKNTTMQALWTTQEPLRFVKLLKTEEKEVEINE